MKFSEALKAARIKAGYSQSMLAAALNITTQEISRYENSDREPRASLVVAMAAALNISTDELLGVDVPNEHFLSVFNRMFNGGITFKSNNKNVIVSTSTGKKIEIDQNKLLAILLEKSAIGNDVTRALIHEAIFNLISQEKRTADEQPTG